MYKLYLEKNTTSKELLNKVLKENNIQDEIIYNAYGKPYLKNKALYFNISHSGIYTALAISNKEVGIDIEKITIKEKVIDKICNPEEKMLIKTADDFTKMWVIKESYVKYLGIGLAYGLQNVDTLSINNFILETIDDYYLAIYGDDLK